MFNSVHRTRAGSGRLESNEVRRGEHAENVPFADSNFTRCRQCGFMANTQRDLHSANGSQTGDGINYAAASSGGGWGHQCWGKSKWGGARRFDPTVQSGCPQCGSHQYQ